MRKNKYSHKFHKIIRKQSGIILIILGIIGGLLPIMPGFIFFITGLSMISEKFSYAYRNALRRFKKHRSITKFVKEVCTSAYVVFIRNRLNKNNHSYKIKKFFFPIERKKFN